MLPKPLWRVRLAASTRLILDDMFTSLCLMSCWLQVVELPREDPAKALRCFASVPNLQVFLPLDRPVLLCQACSERFLLLQSCEEVYFTSTCSACTCSGLAQKHQVPWRCNSKVVPAAYFSCCASVGARAGR